MRLIYFKPELIKVSSFHFHKYICFLEKWICMLDEIGFFNIDIELYNFNFLLAAFLLHILWINFFVLEMKSNFSHVSVRLRSRYIKCLSISFKKKYEADLIKGWLSRISLTVGAETDIFSISFLRKGSIFLKKKWRWIKLFNEICEVLRVLLYKSYFFC